MQASDDRPPPLPRSAGEVAPTPPPLPSGLGAAPPAVARALSLEVGQILDNRYEVRRLVGCGGMGAVYAVWDRVDQEEHAIKLLLPDFLEMEHLRTRFLQEAKITKKLRHESIINVFDVRQHEGLYFIVMELLAGRTLREDKAERSAQGRPYGVDELLALARPICEGLAFAHRSGLVHRDVKPDNIFLCEDGGVRVMDFGIARVGPESNLTSTGQVMGTQRYMAPEQFDDAKHLDARADQYAVALVFFELLTGELPGPRGKSLRELRKDVPPHVSKAIDRALSTSAADRHPDMSAFLQALTGKAARSAGGAEVSSGARTIKVLGALFGLMLVGGAGAWYWESVRAAEPPEELARGDATKTEPPPAEVRDPDREPPKEAPKEPKAQVPAPAAEPVDDPDPRPGPPSEPPRQAPEPPADVDAVASDGTTALVRAVLARDVDEVIRLLDEEGASQEVDGLSGGRQALHHAAELGAVEIVRALLERGADPLVGDERQRSPLHDAVVAPGAEALELLVGRVGDGARLNAADSEGRTPLHLACLEGDLEAARTLLTSADGARRTGVSRHAVDRMGSTPLHHLARCKGGNAQRLVEIAKLLLETEPAFDIALLRTRTSTTELTADEIAETARGFRDPLTEYLAAQRKLHR